MVWDRLLEAVSEAYDGDIVMIDSTCVRVHQHAATGKKGMETMAAWDVPAADLYRVPFNLTLWPSQNAVNLNLWSKPEVCDAI
ncbi:acetamidase/formamidase, partial [Rhizobium leucaenae]|nr:acetamidase/formamidase [Rhizobium leucaenae]